MNIKDYLKKSPLLWLCGLIIPPIFNLTGTLILAYLGKEISSLISLKSDIKTLLVVVAFGVSLLLINSVLYNIGKYLNVLFINKTDYSIKNEVFDKIISSKFPDIKQTSNGDIFTHYNVNTQNFIKIFTEDLYSIVNPIVTGIGIVSSIFITNIYLGLFSLLAVVLVIISNMFFVKKYENIELERISLLGKLNTNINSVIKGLESVKVLNLKDKIVEDISIHSKKVDSNDHKNAILSLKKTLAMDWIIYSVATLILPVACVLVVISNYSLPNVVFVTQLCGNLIWNTKSLGTSIITLKVDISNQKQLQKLFLLPDDEEKQNNCYDVNTCEKAIELKHTTIEYDKVILDKVNISFATGAIHAIIGESGCGKSSIFRAILGLTSYSGEILLNGENLKSYSIADIRNMIAYAPENNSLMSGSISENILYGNVEQKWVDASIVTKASLFDIEDLIDDQTTDSNQLSGGQKQRVCLARALLKNSAIMLLDEPTSSIDIENEQNILNTLIDLAKLGHTVILTTHRTAVINICDTVSLIHDKKIDFNVDKGDAVNYLKQLSS